MDRRAAFALLLLVLAQATHSAEEYVFRLWDRLAPARAVSTFLAVDPATGFVIANTALVAFGLWCWATPARRLWPSARPLAWGWATVETANGLGHVALAAGAADYFPGLYTAPLLLAASAFLAWRLLRTSRLRPAS